MRGSRTRLAALVVFLVGAGAAGLAFTRYADAYAWMSHTSDVQLALGRAIAHADGEPACAELPRDISQFQQLTLDNPIQQARVPGLRFAIERACTRGSTGDLSGRLVEAEAMERDLLWARRQDFAETQRWVLAALVLATLGATAALLVAGFVQRRANKALTTSEDRFRLFAATSRDLIRFHEPSGQTTYVSPSVTAILGYTVEEFVTMPPLGLLHPDDVAHSAAVLHQIQQPFAKDVVNIKRMRAKDGTYRWFEVHVTPIQRSDGYPERYYTTARDITDRVELEKRLEAAAIGDELTGLLNRRGFHMVARQQHRLALRAKQGLAVIYGDLDGLKQINDKLGHEYGDRALKQFAGVMQSVFRDSDVVARLGGDEYAALVYNVTEEQLARVVERLRIATDASPPIGGDRLAVSLGTAWLAPGEVRSLDDLISEADTRMYEAKRARKQTPIGPLRYISAQPQISARPERVAAAGD